MPDKVPVAHPVQPFVSLFSCLLGQTIDQNIAFDAYMKTLRLRHVTEEIACHTIEEAACQCYEIALADYHKELKEYQRNQAILAEQQVASAKAASDSATEKHCRACNTNQPRPELPPPPKTLIMGKSNKLTKRKKGRSQRWSRSKTTDSKRELLLELPELAEDEKKAKKAMNAKYIVVFCTIRVLNHLILPLQAETCSEGLCQGEPRCHKH
jgi:hypothetical protein